MTIDFTDFEKGFKKMCEGRIPSEAAQGLFEAENELLRDAINIIPKAPFKEGHLRASARAEKPEVRKEEIEGQCGFNIEYAARWHELSPAEDSRINWTLPGSGRKYLEIKMMMYKNKYMQIVADFLKKVLK